MKTARLALAIIACTAALSLSAQPNPDQSLHRTFRYVAPQPVLRSIWLTFLNFNFFAS